MGYSWRILCQMNTKEKKVKTQAKRWVKRITFSHCFRLLVLLLVWILWA
ncbi:hypothetical protein NC652_020891 [Populus alba x Populus x berolinensis]|nr:hypothetical protein NC652_020891 [Populus alba x Populus x berolinensis]